MPKSQKVNVHIVTQPDEELEFYVQVIITNFYFDVYIYSIIYIELCFVKQIWSWLLLD